jgi:PPOX class probable F420-dependent enzyme
MAEMSVAERDAFLAQARIGMLATLDTAGAPLAIPIWYDWDGERARMFTSGNSPKVTRLRRDGRVCLTVAEPVGVPEAWVAIEGVATIEAGTGFALAQRLAPRYYSPEQAARTLDAWGRTAHDWVTIVLEPRRIRTSAPV